MSWKKNWKKIIYKNLDFLCLIKKYTYLINAQNRYCLLLSRRWELREWVAHERELERFSFSKASVLLGIANIGWRILTTPTIHSFFLSYFLELEEVFFLAKRRKKTTKTTKICFPLRLKIWILTWRSYIEA